MRSWNMRVCQDNTRPSCHLRAAFTIYTRRKLLLGWHRYLHTMVTASRCSEPGTRKSSRQTASIPILPLPLPPNPCVVVRLRHPPPGYTAFRDSVDVQTCAYSARVFCRGIQGEGTANVLANMCIHLWGRIISFPSRTGFHSFFPSCHSPCPCCRGIHRPSRRQRLRRARKHRHIANTRDDC